MPRPVAIMRCMSEENVLTIGLDADHTLSVKGAPCSIALLCLPEITAAHNSGFRSGLASPLDFLAITRVELDGTKAAVKLDKLYGNNRGASVGDEFLDEGGLIHGKKQRRASRPVTEQYHGWHEKGALRPRCHISLQKPATKKRPSGRPFYFACDALNLQQRK